MKSRIGIDGSIWEAQGGTSRNFRNPLTGEVLSRRQFDKRFGILGKQGFTSYEAKAKASPPELRASRPAINRPTRRASSGFRTLNPLTEKQSRDIPMYFSASFVGEDEDQREVGFLDDASNYEDSYVNAVSEITKNKKIFAVSLKADIRTANSQQKIITFVRLTSPNSLPDFEEMVDQLMQQLYDGDKVVNLIFHIRFKADAIPKSKRKQKMKATKRLKTKRDNAQRRRNKG